MLGFFLRDRGAFFNMAELTDQQASDLQELLARDKQEHAAPGAPVVAAQPAALNIKLWRTELYST